MKRKRFRATLLVVNQDDSPDKISSNRGFSDPSGYAGDVVGAHSASRADSAWLAGGRPRRMLSISVSRSLDHIMVDWLVREDSGRATVGW